MMRLGPRRSRRFRTCNWPRAASGARRARWLVPAAPSLRPLRYRPLARDGAITDVAPILHQIPVNRMHEIVRLTLRRSDARAQPDRAQHAAAGGQHLGVLRAGSGMENFAWQSRRGVETADPIARPVASG